MKASDFTEHGPALLYVHSEGTSQEITVTRVDMVAPLPGFSTLGSPSPDSVNARECRLLRALLEHALHLLSQEEDHE